MSAKRKSNNQSLNTSNECYLLIVKKQCGPVRYIGESGSQGDEFVQEALQRLVPAIGRDLVEINVRKLD